MGCPEQNHTTVDPDDVGRNTSSAPSSIPNTPSSNPNTSSTPSPNPKSDTLNSNNNLQLPTPRQKPTHKQKQKQKRQYQESNKDLESLMSDLSAQPSADGSQSLYKKFIQSIIPPLRSSLSSNQFTPPSPPRESQPPSVPSAHHNRVQNGSTPTPEAGVRQLPDLVPQSLDDVLIYENTTTPASSKNSQNNNYDTFNDPSATTNANDQTNFPSYNDNHNEQDDSYDNDNTNTDDKVINSNNNNDTNNNDLDVDIARPIGESTISNYFLNMLTTASVYAGIGSLGKLRKLAQRDKEMGMFCREYNEVRNRHDSEQTSSPDATRRKSQKPKKQREPSLLGYGVFESESSSSDDSDDEFEDDHEAFSPDESPTEHPEELSPDESPTEHHDDEDEHQPTIPQEPINLVEESPASLRQNENQDDEEEDDEIHDPSTWTPFQRSVVENMDPHSIEEGILVKYKEKENAAKNDLKEQEYQSKKLRIKKEKLRLKIADKLQKVFELDDDDVFYRNYDNWLMMDVLLQGHLYLTRKNVLFFAFLPARGAAAGGQNLENQQPNNGLATNIDDSYYVVHSGSLGMKTAQYGDSFFSSVITHRFWAVLREETLTIYKSPTDLYFPMFVIDLKSAYRVEIIDKDVATANVSPLPHSSTSKSGTSSPSAFLSPKFHSRGNSHSEGARSPRPPLRHRSSSDYYSSTDDEGSEAASMVMHDTEESTDHISGGVWFKLLTKKKTYKFHTDNLYSARQWSNTLTKLLFQIHNANSRNEVLIKIPLDNLIDFQKSAFLSNPSQEPTEGDEEVPLSFAIKYLEEEDTSNVLNAKNIKRRFKRSTQKNVLRPQLKINLPDDNANGISQNNDEEKAQTPLFDVGQLYFLFFRKGHSFYDTFSQIIHDRAVGRQRENDDASSIRSSNRADWLVDKAKKMVRQRAETIGGPSKISYTKNRPISTLSPTAISRNTIIEQISSLNAHLMRPDVLSTGGNSSSGIVSPNGDESMSNLTASNPASSRGSDESSNKLKRFGKALSSPSRLFGKNNSTPKVDIPGPPSAPLNDFSRPSIHQTDSTLLDKNAPDFEHNDLPNTSQQNNTIQLPRELSVTGLKKLNMSFETSKRHLDIAESRYDDQESKNGSSDTTNSSSDANKDSLGSDSSSSNATSTTRQPIATPLKLSDPSEYKDDYCKKQSKIRTIGKSMKVLSNMGNLWVAHPSHYDESIPDDSYFVRDTGARDIAVQHYREHFSLNNDTNLVATYCAHLQRAIPVYGKLYLGEEELCFRSLLPGVSTKMILPLGHIENCFKEKGLKLATSGLVIVIAGQDELFLEFGSQKGRDDCEIMLLKQLGKYKCRASYKARNIEISDGTDHAGDFQSANNRRFAAARIQNARLKLFEDKLNAAAGLDLPLILEDSPFLKTEIRPSTSFNITLLTIGSRGDVQPYIALAKGLMTEGHRVTIATHEEFEPWITKHDIQFQMIAGNPAELMALMVKHGSMSVAFLKEASAKFRKWIKELLASSWRACQGADILIESPSAMGGIHIAEALGIPYIRAFTMPWTRTRAYPHAFIVPDQKKGGSYNYLTHVMFENVFWKGISGQINRWRVEELKLPRTNLYKMQQSKVPFLYNVSPTIFPPSVDFPDWVRVTGYWFLDEGAVKDYEPPAELIKFIDTAHEEGKKVVYIGFGSIVVNDSKTLTKAVVEAVLDADVRCILNKGWSDRLDTSKGDEVEIELPKEIYNSGSIPHDWLFKRIDACVHHGGSGTTGSSLRAGLPTVIKPFFGDQFFYASRVEEVGVGLALKKLNAKSLSKALKTVTRDSKIMERASQNSERIKHENGVATAVETIYSELEYARNLIIAKQQHNEQSRLHENKGSQTPVVYEDEEEEEVLSEAEDQFALESGTESDIDEGDDEDEDDEDYDHESEDYDSSDVGLKPSYNAKRSNNAGETRAGEEVDLTNPVHAFSKKERMFNTDINVPSDKKPEKSKWYRF